MPIFRTECWLPRKQEEVFAFFADAMNLEAITPAWLRFSVLTPAPIEMTVGARIDYRLRWRGVPLYWQTEITRWDPPHAFVDEQRHGPYRRWVHTHTFWEQGGGTWCWDRVQYQVPGGRFIDRLLVRRDLERIFHHRHRAMWSHFGRGQPERAAAVLFVARARRGPRGASAGRNPVSGGGSPTGEQKRPCATPART